MLRCYYILCSGHATFSVELRFDVLNDMILRLSSLAGFRG